MKKTNNFFSITLGFVVTTAAFSFAAPAQAVTLTFDELPFQSVDDLSFMGVTFDFKVGGVDSPDAFYNSIGPGITSFISDPSLEGNSSGILTLDFDNNISELDFGVALSAFNPLSPGFTVELFDENLNSLGANPVNTNPLISFTEGMFSYIGGSLVKRAVIDFDNSAGRFVLDNLHFEEETESVSTPEPTIILGFLSVIGVASKLKRKQVLN